MPTGSSTAERRKLRTRGATLVEASLVLLFFMGLLFLLIDLSWGLLAKATLQHAVRSGVRYAVTNQTGTKKDPVTGANIALGQVDSIKQVVKKQAMGFLSDADLNAKVFVRFYLVTGGAPQLVTGAGSNMAGNLVVVSIENFSLSPMVPLLRSGTPVPITVRAGDLLEGQPAGGPPPL